MDEGSGSYIKDSTGNLAKGSFGNIEIAFSYIDSVKVVLLQSGPQ